MTKSTSGGSEPVWTPEASSPWPDGTPDASTSRPDGSTTPTLAPVSPVGGPKGQRQARLQSMLALLGAAALVGVAVIGVAAAAQPGGSNRGTVLTAGSTGAAGATGAAGSPGAAGTSGPTGPNVVQGGRGRGPGGGPWAFGGFPFGGRGGPTGPGGPRFGGGVFGFGGVTITVINGSQLSLKTADGWTRTIDVTGATIRRGSQSITVADLAVGDQIAFRETRNADGTFKIAAIEVIQPQVDGTITEVGPSSVTVSQPGGRTTVVQLSSSTTYAIAGKGPNGTSATKDSLTVGARIHAVGTRVADGTFTATSVQVAPAQVIGIVTATTSDSITIKDPRGTMVTIKVDSSTTYQSPGVATSSLKDVAVNGWVEAEGTLNADGSLSASVVRILPGMPGPGRRGGFGGRGGPRGAPGGGAPGGAPASTPAPSGTSG